MDDTLDHGKRRARVRAADCCRLALAAIILIAQLFPPAVARATDLPGVLPAALDQPRINAVLRRTPTGAPLSVDIGGVDVYNIEAFFDTGASGVLLSTETSEALGVQKQQHLDPESGELVDVVFEDVGVAGSESFGVSEQLHISLSPYFEPGQGPELESYIHTFGPIRGQISAINPNPLLAGLDVFGMPTMTGKVVVMDPKPTDPFNPNLGTMHTFVYEPGTPFNPATPEIDPGIPAVDRHIDLSYGTFDRFTQVAPAGAPGPTLRNNPFIGPNPVLQLDPSPPPDDTPGVSITFGDQSSTGSWLLDTGAAASIISLTQAANLHVRYRLGTEGTDNPRLETFDPLNPGVEGDLIPDQFALDVGGVGGTIKRSGFYLDSLLLRTQEGDAAVEEDPDHIRYLGAAVLVFDITLQDPITQQSLTLDGIFGMNMLVGTASFTPGPIPSFDALADGYYNWITFDEPNGVLGLDLKDIISLPPNEWIRSSSANWGTAANWANGEVPDGNAQSALLGPAITSHASVDLEATDRTLRTLRFSHASRSYTVTSSAGGSLLFEAAAGPASIQFDLANTTSHAIAAPVRFMSDVEFHGLIVDPQVKLTLSGSQTWDPTTTFTVKSGTLRYDLDNADLVISDGDNALVIDDGAAVQLAGERSPFTGSHSVLDVVTYVDVMNNSTGDAFNNTPAGLIIEAGDHAAGSLTGVGSASISGAASFTATVIRQSALTLNAGSTATVRLSGTDAETSVFGALSIAGTPSAPTATLDLTNNAAVIDYAETSPAATVRQQILAGRGGAGLGAAWTGPGITSSAAATVNAGEEESRSVGYAENAELPLGAFTDFHGQPVDDTSIVMAYTRTGDANLDGIVNDDDVTIVGATYAPGVPQPSWALGDFDYNGFVDDDDVTLLGVFYNPSAEPLITPASPPPGATGVAAVPEPSTVALLGLMIAVLAIAAVRRRLR